MKDAEWTEEENRELVQNTRVMKFDLDKNLMAALITELDRMHDQAGHPVLTLTEAVNDAISNYIMNLRVHNFTRLN